MKFRGAVKKLLGIFLIMLAVTGMVLNKFMVFSDGFFSQYWWAILGIPIVLFAVLKLVPGDEDDPSQQ